MRGVGGSALDWLGDSDTNTPRTAADGAVCVTVIAWQWQRPGAINHHCLFSIALEPAQKNSSNGFDRQGLDPPPLTPQGPWA